MWVWLPEVSTWSGSRVNNTSLSIGDGHKNPTQSSLNDILCPVKPPSIFCFVACFIYYAISNNWFFSGWSKMTEFIASKWGGMCRIRSAWIEVHNYISVCFLFHQDNFYRVEWALLIIDCLKMRYCNISEAQTRNSSKFFYWPKITNIIKGCTKNFGGYWKFISLLFI